MDKSLIECADSILKKLYKRRIGIDNDEIIVEKPWFTEEIRSEMKKTKELNRKKRNCKTIKEKETYTKEWEEQRIKYKLMIKKAIEDYEIKITNDIKNSDNRGKLLWKNINKLRGKEKIKAKQFNL